MSKHFNDFCRYCTGNIAKDINQCDDENCPYHPFRFGGLEKEVDEDINKNMKLSPLYSWRLLVSAEYNHSHQLP